MFTYLLTPKGISEKISMTKEFLRKRIDEYEMLQSEITRLENDISNNHQKFHVQDKK